MRLVEGVASVEDVDAFVARLGDIGDEHGCAVQAFDADYVADRAHLESAVEHANRAFERGENVASDRAVEILLYAAGRRQIRRALAMGVDEGESDVVVVVDGEPRGGSEQASGRRGGEAASNGTGAERSSASSRTGEARETTAEPSPAPRDGEDEAAAASAVADLLDDQATLGGDSATLREFFDVSDAERAVVDDLSGVVRERVALLDVEK